LTRNVCFIKRYELLHIDTTTRIAGTVKAPERVRATRGSGMDKTLLKGLDVLAHVVRSDQNVRITDVANDLNLTKSNAYRMLKTLESAGYLRQHPTTKDFAPSLRLWELGMLVVGRLDLRGLAADALRRLADESRETVHLAVLDGREVIYIEKIDSPEPVGTYTRLGGRAPAYCVATGKALLSQMDEAALAPLLDNLPGLSRFTITDPDALRAELAETNARGYAINRGEWRETVWGLASPVRDPSGAAVAAVGVSGPSFRLDNPARCAELAQLVMRAARDISSRLGGNAEPPRAASR
jgi:IclR family KDG regulon transcriptional repressor